MGSSFSSHYHKHTAFPSLKHRLVSILILSAFNVGLDVNKHIEKDQRVKMDVGELVRKESISQAFDGTTFRSVIFRNLEKENTSFAFLTLVVYPTTFCILKFSLIIVSCSTLW